MFQLYSHFEGVSMGFPKFDPSSSLESWVYVQAVKQTASALAKLSGVPFSGWNLNFVAYSHSCGRERFGVLGIHIPLTGSQGATKSFPNISYHMKSWFVTCYDLKTFNLLLGYLFSDIFLASTSEVCHRLDVIRGSCGHQRCRGLQSWGLQRRRGCMRMPYLGMMEIGNGLRWKMMNYRIIPNAAVNFSR